MKLVCHTDEHLWNLCRIQDLYAGVTKHFPEETAQESRLKVFENIYILIFFIVWSQDHRILEYLRFQGSSGHHSPMSSSKQSQLLVKPHYWRLYPVWSWEHPRMTFILLCKQSQAFLHCAEQQPEDRSTILCDSLGKGNGENESKSLLQ